MTPLRQAINRVQESELDRAESLSELCNSLKLWCTEKAAIYRDDLCQDMIADILDNVIPGYVVKAQAIEAEAGVTAAMTAYEMRLDQ